MLGFKTISASNINLNSCLERNQLSKALRLTSLSHHQSISDRHKLPVLRECLHTCLCYDNNNMLEHYLFIVYQQRLSSVRPPLYISLQAVSAMILCLVTWCLLVLFFYFILFLSFIYGIRCNEWSYFMWMVKGFDTVRRRIHTVVNWKFYIDSQSLLCRS